MNFKYRIFLCCILFLFISLPGFSQINSLGGQNLSSIKVDDITDEDITTYYQKAVDKGLSDEDMYNLLAQKGLPQEELAKLTDRIAKIKPLIDTTPKTKDNKRTDDKKTTDTSANSRYSDQDASQVPVQVVKRDLSILDLNCLLPIVPFLNPI